MTNTHTAPAADLRVVPFTFAATTVEVEALTPAGRAFLAQHLGAGAVSMTLRKSGLLEVERVAALAGLVVA